MDASIGFLLENLKEIILNQKDLIQGAEQEFKGLKDDLAKLMAILVKASKESAKDEVFQELEGRVREAVYDIEDVIDTCVTEAKAAKAGKKNWFKKHFSLSKGTIALAQEVKTIRERVTPLMKEADAATFTIDKTNTTAADTREARQKKSTHIVGFEEEAVEFVDRLTKESEQLEILSVIGMAGLGKTTFAWKVYEDETIKYEFPLRIWVNISENPNMKNVFLQILSQLTSAKPDESATEANLAKKIKCHLEEGKYLIVMDDIWTIKTWTTLKDLLPANNKWGRVLITTRITDVGRVASRQKAHNLRFLTAGESWELLQYEVFSNLDDVPEELKRVGPVIATDCKGLPLSIVVIGGILQEKTFRSPDNNITAIIKEWERVSGSVKSYLAGEDMLGSIISLSYDNLPYELRNCFLYIGIFPEDAEIPVKKLIQLWIAEGLVPDTEERRLEEIALDNLKKLINRNLVIVRKEKLDGEPKICQIHDSIRAICKQEGGKLNLFTDIGKSGTHSNTEGIRRLCIHSQARNFFSTKPKLPKARSFLCFNESSMILEGKDATSIIEAFGLLRVYDAKDMKFQIFPSKLVQQLHHLRYLTLVVATEFKTLPESVTNLWNLQTLIVDTPSSTFEVKVDLWKMRHLRHFKTKASIILSKKGGDGNDGSNGGKELQTLTRLSPESCTTEVCRKATSLVNLGIKGDLRKLCDSKCFGELDSLNKLKLVHEVCQGGAADNPLRQLPDSFPPKLQILVLSGTRLDWAKMSTLSTISTLEVLKLKEHAFQGKNWEAEGTGFINLIWLDIGRSDLTSWTASTNHFPELRFLLINNCNNLTVIPPTLGKKLEVLSLENVTVDARKCAEKIKENEEKKGKKKIRLQLAAGDKNRQS